MKKLILSYAPSKGSIAIFRGTELSGQKEVSIGGATRSVSTRTIRFSDIPLGDFRKHNPGSREAVLSEMTISGFRENEIVTVLTFE